MLRTAIIRTAASASTRIAAAAARPASAGAFRPAMIARAGAAVPRWPALQTVRMYSAGSGLEKQEVEQRIFGILRNFDKVGASLPAQLALGCLGYCCWWWSWWWWCALRFALLLCDGMSCDVMRCHALHHIGEPGEGNGCIRQADEERPFVRSLHDELLPRISLMFPHF